jgi:hypothetical protein
MRSLDELTFQIELPLKPADVIDRIEAACDDLAVGVDRRFDGVGTGRRPLWGSVAGEWFRVRAIGIGHKGPAAEGRVIPVGTGSRVIVRGEMSPQGRWFALVSGAGETIGSVVALMIGFSGEPGSVTVALIIGAVSVGAAWAGYRWQLNTARRTRQVLMNVLTGAPPSPAKWRPRLQVRRLDDRQRSPTPPNA